MFFGRLVTIYGRSRAKTLWGDSDSQLVVMRREWARTLGRYSFDELEVIFERLKDRLAAGDPELKWPDVPKILALGVEHKTKALHRVRPPGLPEPEWRKQERYACGRLASKTAQAVLRGAACFIEDRPED